jgi:hypothetical protein
MTPDPPVLDEGWYLMNLDELEQELRRARRPRAAPPSGAIRMSIEEALARRNAGNLPDADGRTLRLVLHVSDPPEPGALERRRLHFEADLHDEPTWRRPGSLPVHIVPLPVSEGHRHEPRPWFEQPEVASLEQEWRRTGSIDGVNVPGDVRGFLWKTVLALRAAGKEISVETLSASVARWLEPDDAARIRHALEHANPEGEARPERAARRA